jgi:hypothetical protein
MSTKNKSNKHKSSKHKSRATTESISNSPDPIGTDASPVSEKTTKKAEKAAKREAERILRKAEKVLKKAEKTGVVEPAPKSKSAKQPKAAKVAGDASDKQPPSQPADVDAPGFKHVRKKKLTSGKGPTPLEVGQSLVALVNAGKSEEAESTWYHRKIESIEDDGSVFEGWKGVLEKGKWWKENFTVLSMRAEGPYVCSTGFSVVYSGRLRMPDGTEVDAHEIGVYTVAKGRIVREQFMKRSF